MSDGKQKAVPVTTVKPSLTAKLFVKPITSMVTERVCIRGNNFKPNSPVTIQASLNCPSEKLSFNSQACYLTNDDGCFNLNDTEAYDGSYNGTYGMGLFWSMKNHEDSYKRIQMTNSSTQLEYDISIYHGHLSHFENVVPVDTVTIIRMYAHDNTIRLPVKSGNIRGTMFIPEGNGPLPAIITMYGGNKRKSVVEDAAGILSNHGFVTLALASFGVDSLPKSYRDQPLQIEYFEEAVEFLLAHEKVNDRIGIWGLSKGGEIAFGMVSFLTQIKCICCINSCVSSTANLTTYKDKSTDMLSYDENRITLKQNHGNVLNVFDFLGNSRDEPNSVHTFYESEADILIIVGLDDESGPYEDYADFAKELMDEVGKVNYEIVKYPGIGHLIDAPYMPPCAIYTHPAAPPGCLIDFGGSDMYVQSINSEEMWKKIIDFFIKSLRYNDTL